MAPRDKGAGGSSWPHICGFQNPDPSNWGCVQLDPRGGHSCFRLEPNKASTGADLWTPGPRVVLWGHETTGWASRASTVSPTLPQTKSLWGEGRRLPDTARQLGCVRERVPVCRCVLRGTGVAQGHRKSFLSFGFLCTLPRDYAEAKAKANAVLPEPEPLFRKFPGAQQLLLTPQLGRRGPKGSRAGRDTPARDFRHCGSGQSAAPAFPACPQTPDPAQVSSRLYVAGEEGRTRLPWHPGRGYSAGSTF